MTEVVSVETVACPQCLGSGRVTEVTLRLGNECPRCGGEGRLLLRIYKDGEYREARVRDLRGQR
jgi:DnaJ-class molecular chaperone